MKIILKICLLVILHQTSYSFGQEANQNDGSRIDSMSISAKKCHEYAQVIPDEKQKDLCGIKMLTITDDGNNKAEPREFPHMALVGFDKTNETVWPCGGTLISERYVLTAAHCVTSRFGPPKYVRLGELNLKLETDDADPENFNVIESISHPDYNKKSKYNDIALLKLDRSVEFNEYKRPACLPSEYKYPSKVLATGWGRKDLIGPMSSHLKKLFLDIVSESDCDDFFSQHPVSRHIKGIEHKLQICAGASMANKDTCRGDGGGPLQIYHNSEYCMYEIIGITSFGVSCGVPDVPGVYTKVYSYIDWIENIVWNKV